ncbi:hypothetical protein [Thermoflavimicrobium dichotomicum]|uniref:HEAT repeat-containing protein n=1 Tax=Thermoflavimicrobium dichotomicum TaxID=46223 RepID=A0A1I3TT35_9BACL|nr:hypothetical protein [Thermoflavimicrobium dichotomicum]SFJ73945.1 hypothetical protein SAMN05421852_11968 [Thermoflavimicrobium dichotomicum]
MVRDGQMEWKRAGLERKRRKAWWKEAKPRVPLPDSIREYLDKNDPEFMDELLKYAFSFTYDPKSTQKSGAWIWTLYLDDRPLAQEGFKQLLTTWPYTKLLLFTPNRRWDGKLKKFRYSNQGYREKYTFLPFTKPLFRYLKGIYKLAEERRDATIWARFAYMWDQRFLYQPHMVISPNTKRYLQRRAWRTLRQLGEQGSPDYVHMATELLLCYEDNDMNWFNGSRIPYGTQKVICQILYRHSRYIKLEHGAIKFKHDKDIPRFLKERAEAFPELWDQHPEQLLRIIQEAKATPVVQFAIRALKQGNPAYLEKLSLSCLWDLLKRFHEEDIVAFAMENITKRMDMKEPDLDQLFGLLNHSNYHVRTRAIEFVKQNRHHWTFEQIAWLIQKMIQHPYTWYLDEWIKLIEQCWMEEFRQLASFEWIRPLGRCYWLSTGQEQLTCMVLDLLMETKSGCKWEDLLPFLGNCIPLHVRQKIYDLFMREKDLVDINGMVGLIYANVFYEDVHQQFIRNWFQEHKEWLEPRQSELIQALLKKVTSKQTSSNKNAFVIKELFGEVLWEKFCTLSLEELLPLLEVNDNIPECQNLVKQWFLKHRLHLIQSDPEWLHLLWSWMVNEQLPAENRTFIGKDLLSGMFWKETCQAIPLEKILKLLHSDLQSLRDFALKLLESKQVLAGQFPSPELLSLAHARDAAVRAWARDRLIQVMEKVDEDGLVYLTQTDWDDTRNWMFGYLKTLSDEKVTPKLIYGLLDSARTDIQQFAMEMAAIYEKRIDLTELMLRASESPDLNVQAYALDLADRVRWDEEILRRMEYFFRTVLFYVGKGRKLKQKALRLLLQLGESDSNMAQIVLSLLADVARTSGQKDFEEILRMMAKIKQRYPETKTVIQMKRIEEAR